ncbi:MAG: hypothetical protein HUJ51_04895 [Eggerthellaceae bacterium]|nr:hypothetical protein [Eggerthellaceae bacterium]
MDAQMAIGNVLGGVARMAKEYKNQSFNLSISFRRMLMNTICLK